MQGAAAPDGSPVDAYARLPAEPELAAVRRHLDRPCRVLDLGCGAGRIADPLARDGHQVVAVDECSEMVARVRAAQPVHHDIESLELSTTFDVVLLLSHLVNSSRASAFLSAAARHLADDGVLIVQRLAPGTTWRPGFANLGDVTIRLSGLEVDGERIRGTTAYTVDGRTARQRWEQWERSDEQLREMLATVGLCVEWADGAWVTATPGTLRPATRARPTAG